MYKHLSQCAHVEGVELWEWEELNCLPFHLLAMFLFPGLGLHLLDLNGVGLSAAHVKLVVTHTQSQDALVDAKTRGIEDKVLDKIQDVYTSHTWCMQHNTYIVIQSINKLSI